MLLTTNFSQVQPIAISRGIGGDSVNINRKDNAIKTLNRFLPELICKAYKIAPILLIYGNIL